MSGCANSVCAKRCRFDSYCRQNGSLAGRRELKTSNSHTRPSAGFSIANCSQVFVHILDVDGLYRLVTGEGRIPEHSAVQLVAHPRGRGLEQLVASLEMLISRASIDACSLRNLCDAQSLLAILRQHFTRRFKNHFARALRIAPASPFFWHVYRRTLDHICYEIKPLGNGV